MPKKTYGQLEEHIINTFQKDRIFTYHQKLYEVMFAGKPRPQGSGGECKTDVFVRAKEQGTENIEDIKISVKNNNKEFMGNKLKKEDVEAYFGPEWEDIIIEATTSLKSSFEDRVLVYASGKHPTKPNSVTVGWKLEVADRPRALSTKIPLSDQEIRDYVYKGTNLEESKKNSIVNGQVVRNSGVADYLITTSMADIKSADDVIAQMELIDEADIGDTYFIFTANNYRTDVDKADGPRSLAVRVEWECNNNKMEPTFCYDKPLQYTGERDMAPYVKAALKALRIENAKDLRPGFTVDDKYYLE